MSRRIAIRVDVWSSLSRNRCALVHQDAKRADGGQSFLRDQSLRSIETCWLEEGEIPFVQRRSSGDP